ncbi:hypothetical protein GBAR_LOCUS4180 [Geodia barretti]|uniref:Uncharacterized protein n=1 Tax=Geodia barretti TaxID=519541 RepID=A0AA35R7U8_GEOBA|nr:hypothetical protein GBAR_LOCUS4180 [Geodia barretti]
MARRVLSQRERIVMVRCNVWVVFFSQAVLTVPIISGTDNLPLLLPPQRCLCPNEDYICEVTSGVGIVWRTVTINGTGLSVINDEDTLYIEEGGFQIRFVRNLGNFTSVLHVSNLNLNETDITCEGIYFVQISRLRLTNTTKICIAGPASPPTSLSVVWDSPSAVVSFQSPVYGGECVDYYVVTAVSGERNVSCNATSDGSDRNCSIYLGDGNVNDYNFTVHGVTRVNDSFVYNGDIATDCYLSIPENVRAVEEECGRINVTWKSSHNMTAVNTTISWGGVHSSGARHYERGSSEDSHLLTLDYSETGPVEIAVTFSSAVCNKTTTITLNRKRCLTASETTPVPTPGGFEFTCPVVEECSSTSYTAVGVGVAGGVVVGLISGIVGTVTVLLVIMRKRASKGTSNRDTELSATKYVCVSYCTHLRIIVSGIALCQRMTLFFS